LVVFEPSPTYTSPPTYVGGEEKKEILLLQRGRKPL